jgi:hypothetical protein
VTALWDLIDAAPAPIFYAAVAAALVAFAILERASLRGES